MKITILLLSVLLVVTSCKRQSDEFEFTIKGTIIGEESGQFYLSKSNRVGDEIIIPFENYSFTYIGTTPNMYGSFIFWDYDLQSGVFQFVVEPGEIVLELHPDSLRNKSLVILGDYNIAMREAQEEYRSLFLSLDSKTDETKLKIIDWHLGNKDNFETISRLGSIESYENFMPIDKLGVFIKGVKDRNLRKSREYIELYSLWLAKKDSVNTIGKTAMEFKLPDIDGNITNFKSVAKNKITFVENSGSWCGNTTNNTRRLLPVYERFKDHGLEIITIVNETKHDRWEKWLEREKFPWINLVDFEPDIAKRGLSYTKMLFAGGNFMSVEENYLVDEDGFVIAQDLTPDALKEKLLERFEPEAYQEYMENKWAMPEKIFILDQEQPINSFSELLDRLPSKAFLIDCWATWCSPCFEEFKYNDQLKAFLKSKNMESVYISFDQPADESKWLNTIREQNLQGSHCRVNDSLLNELIEIGFEGFLPVYLIVNKDGEVVEKNAFRPSQTEKLYSQINNLIE
jgi:peroxiredoxin